VATTGTAFCWGDNGSGQLGIGSTSTRTMPTALPSIVDAVSVTAGRDHTCILMMDATLRCFGSNSWGQIGTTGGSVLWPTNMPAISTVAEVFAGGDHTFAIDATGQAYGFGSNIEYEMTNAGLGSIVRTPSALRWP